mmetsp:Transcript_7602/g.14432  ORF Transcript_7602/g.14432 Transcript_7602/m.14432 type:complete len:703 (-) Transcript_7602:136-2244(-)|eukprot:scaffold1536_cov166-Amphora_coffeaeformis.AAC.7
MRVTATSLVSVLLLVVLLCCQNQNEVDAFTQRSHNSGVHRSSATLLHISKREAEIRRKIMNLKKEGRIKKKDGSLWEDEDDDDEESPKSAYEDKVVQRLGKAKSKMLGFTGSGEDSAEPAENEEESSDVMAMRQGQLGAIPKTVSDDESESTGYIRPEVSTTKNPLIDPSLFMGDEDEEDDEGVSEEELVDLVAQKMMEKRDKERREKEERLRQEAREKLEAIEKERQAASEEGEITSEKQLTSGVGGKWSKNETAVEEDVYKPKSGSWGAFPRPRDISKAYGGGRRIGPGFSDEEARLKSTEETRERLKRYREKMGIEVQSEKEHADEINQALEIAALAMRRGVYSTAVSALEKVTQWCSTNSKIGGKVFLELAMAYEAVGRTQEAITVYSTLSRSRMEDVKFNAKRLLYGLEAMQFMQNEVRSKDFARNKAKNTFIDATGLDKFAQNFDDVYQTAYVDLQGNFYKKLTESVVRSPREARQVLLQATGSGEVGRARIVQALRSLSRNFDDALQKEIEKNTVKEPVAVMNGKPIITKPLPEEENTSTSMEEFTLMEASKMMDRLNGQWRLQLLADKRGDGVKFFNNTLSSQQVDIDSMTFSATVPSGFITVQQKGKIVFNEKRRILRRQSVEVSGGGMLAGILGATSSGAPGAVRMPQQIMTVDSVLLVTRGLPSKRPKNVNEAEKDYFAVWRRVGDTSNEM